MRKQTDALSVNVPDYQAPARQDWCINHHGAVKGLTGYWHELSYTLKHNLTGILIDCGLFQGDETQEYALPCEPSPDSIFDDTIPFEINHISYWW